MEPVKLRDLPLGSLFRYMDGTPKVYVLLNCGGSGLVADSPADVRGPRPFQGLYSAAESRQEFEKLQVLPVTTPDLNLSDPAVQKRLAAQWGYVPAPAAPVARPEPSDGWASAYTALEKNRNELAARVRFLEDHAKGEVWVWQGDGEDHPESLANSLPVVIRADQLRELIAAVPTAPVAPRLVSNYFTQAEIADRQRDQLDMARDQDAAMGRRGMARDQDAAMRPATPVAQCACCPEGLLDSYAGGAAPEGLFGRVTLLINGQRVDYVPATAAPVVPAGWRFEVRQDPGGEFVSIYGPAPRPGERSQRTSDVVYKSGNRDLFDLLARLADHQERAAPAASVAKPLECAPGKPGVVYVDGFGYVDERAVRAIERAHRINQGGA